MSDSNYHGLRQRWRARIAGRRRVTPTSPPEQIRELILADGYLFRAYGDLYTELGALALGAGLGPVIEIGAGTGVGKEWIPELLCTDVSPGDRIDRVVDAVDMPFGDATIAAFILKDALHHIPDAGAFLDECIRCLRPGGLVAISDPYWGPLASLVYRYLHPEPFDRLQGEWRLRSRGPWDSNQALLWILLRRDRHEFERRFPLLEVNEVGARLGPSYLLSGGVFGRTRIPSRLLAWLLAGERSAGRWLDPLRFEFIVVLRRLDDSASGSNVPG